MTSKIEGDQLKMIVWSFSSTCERPLRRSSSFSSRPELSTPIRAEKTKMPDMVTTRETPRKGQPISPPIVPASMVRISDSQAPSTKLRCSPPSGAMPVSASTRPAAMMTTSDITASQPIRAIGPAAMLLSNW
ncbi:hypothetical protein LJR245_003096 [Rhizobium leguminosarum]|uniref:hypothetical protein n=1 Tax=Rhizobium leguminosarum TaxID=384 RepID=UPI003ECFC3CA